MWRHLWTTFFQGYLCIEYCKKEGLVNFEIIEVNRWNLIFLTFLGCDIRKLWLFLKLTMPSLIIYSKWHIVTLVSNNVKNSRNLVCHLILGRGIHIWHLFPKTTICHSLWIMKALSISKMITISGFLLPKILEIPNFIDWTQLFQ